MKLLERSRRINYILCGCIFVGVIVYTLLSTGNKDLIYFKPSADGLLIEGPQDYKIDIPYGDIENIELLKTFDRGESAGGVIGTDICYGTFENELYGKYELFSIPSVKTHIALTTGDGRVYVINRENNGDTENYYDALAEKIG